MKESITKFDLEAAFKALDEIEAPKADKVKANRPALTEIFSRKTKFDTLMEEYYDVNDMSELDDAKEAREAEVAQAKLARIEKIVDLDAESPEDLLPSYVGKFIMQCPQCMTLFYKDPEDVEASEEDPSTVNVNEVCQHCGNEAGYTLIGKVGEATQEEAADFMGEETVDVTSTDEGEESVAEPAEDEELGLEAVDLEDVEDLDLDLDLDADEEVGDEEKKEESFANGTGEQILTEQLTEAADLDVSAEEFEELINSPEFKKPISDNETRAMLADESISDENIEESFEEDDSIFDQAEELLTLGKFSRAHWANNIVPKVKRINAKTYKITHNKAEKANVIVELSPAEPGTYNFSINGDRCSTDKLAEAQEFILEKLQMAYAELFNMPIDESVGVNSETLRYAVINPDGTYAGVPCTSEEEARDLAAQKEGRIIVELGKLVESLEEDVLDKIKSGIGLALGTREARANWVLANALKDYNDVKVSPAGELVPDEANQRFNTFVVVGYTSKYNNGKAITTAPSFDNKDLVVADNGVKELDNYSAADKVAKGWSMIQGNGPAFIYLAKSKNDPNAVFLCEYFKGKLSQDQLDKYFKVVKNHLNGTKLMQKGLNGDTMDSAVADEDMAARTTKVKVTRKANEDLQNTLEEAMTDIEELQESSMESLISDSLVEAYGNVAGFKLAESELLEGKLSVHGTIYFTSGNTRKTSYIFTEALKADGDKIKLTGLNEKLGLDKSFTISGYADANKTFITESFKVNKK